MCLTVRLEIIKPIQMKFDGDIVKKSKYLNQVYHPEKSIKGSCPIILGIYHICIDLI